MCIRDRADTLIYRNDVRNYLKKLVEINEDDNLPILGLGDMMNVRKNVPKDKSGNIVAVYYAYPTPTAKQTAAPKGYEPF